MARRRRNTEIELNFDGLTDAVTNLVGALILLVLLLVGVTREYVIFAQPTAPPPPAPNMDEPLEGPKTLDELHRQVAVLRAAIIQADQEITELEQKMPDLRDRAEILISGGAGDP